MASTDRRTVQDGLAVVERPGTGGPLVVLVHGALDRASSFGRVVRKLPDLHLLRYDRRGYGRSEPGRAVDLEAHVDDLLSLIAGRPAVVFGHSFGGTVALAAAARPESSVLALVAFESPVATVAAPEPFPREPGEEPAEVAERFMRTMAGDAVWSRLPSRTRAERRAEGPALLADLDSARDDARAVEPSAVTIPVVVGVGGRSGRGAMERARALAEALPSASLRVVAEAGHGVHLTHPAEAADLVLDAVGCGDPGGKSPA